MNVVLDVNVTGILDFFTSNLTVTLLLTNVMLVDLAYELTAPTDSILVLVLVGTNCSSSL